MLANSRTAEKYSAQNVEGQLDICGPYGRERSGDPCCPIGIQRSIVVKTSIPYPL
jgi:hypothetical protein